MVFVVREAICQDQVIQSQFGIGGQNGIMYKETYNALLVLAFLEDCLIPDCPNFEEMNNTWQSLPEDLRVFLESTYWTSLDQLRNPIEVYQKLIDLPTHDSDGPHQCWYTIGGLSHLDTNDNHLQAVMAAQPTTEYPGGLVIGFQTTDKMDR